MPAPHGATCVFFETAGWERRYLARAARPLGLRARFVDEPLTDDALADVRGAGVLSTFIYSRLTAPLVKRLRGVRMIATRSTSFDHLDLQACRKAGIMVANVPAYGENTVAEHTFALILALSRNVPRPMSAPSKAIFRSRGCRGLTCDAPGDLPADEARRAVDQYRPGRLGGHARPSLGDG